MGGNCLTESLSLPHLLSLLSPPHTSLYTHFPFFPWNFLLYLSPTLFTALNLCKALYALYFSFNVLKIVLSIVYTPILLPFSPLRCQYYEHLLCRLWHFVFFSFRLSFSIHNFHHVVFICHYSSCMSTSLYIFSLPNSLSYFSFIPLVSQTQNRVSRSLCTTCALSVTPSESQRPSDHIAWWFAPSMKTRLRSWSAMAEPCCGSSEPTPAKLPILGTHTYAESQIILQSYITISQLKARRNG